MKIQFWKKSKWILTGFIVAIVITTCTAYGKEKDEENKEDEWNVDFEIERAEYRSLRNMTEPTRQEAR